MGGRRKRRFRVGCFWFRVGEDCPPNTLNRRKGRREAVRGGRKRMMKCELRKLCFLEVLGGESVRFSVKLLAKSGGGIVFF